MRPTLAIYLLQRVQGYSSSLHDYIYFLKLFNEPSFLTLFDNITQIYGPKYLTD